MKRRTGVLLPVLVDGRRGPSVVGPVRSCCGDVAAPRSLLAVAAGALAQGAV